MKKVSLKKIADKMKNLDICMMTTQDGRNVYHSRPMSNNGKVEYDGNSYFFTYMKSTKVKHISTNPKVSLLFQNDKHLFIECYGTAKLIKDKKVLKDKWVDGLEMWFPKGIETPGICLLKVEAKRVHFWDKKEEAEYKS
ncbi:MAG TPA: pyridoxamine 5'-phosphate oxidase family protein [Bacteroidia bacterium]|jgi:general stress protein 26|nr:pyridoxamine 5'-phosphate oxidase family protein [Bacteroidia bacterium]HRG52838.1 pyridoxamine 5'-phosphate oxidase family protein [Bacteroidia bacterium]